MKTRNTVLRWWLLVSLSLGPILISCANKNVEETADGETDAYEESVTEGGESSDSETTAENTDTGFDEDEKTEEAKTEESTGEELAATDEKKTEEQKDFEPLADDDFENLSFDEAGTQGSETTTAENNAVETTTSAPSENLSENLFENTDSAATTASSDIGLGASPMLQDPVQNTAPKPFRASVMPKIPQEAVEKGGASLNRYYFLRKGDTPNGVAKLIYGEENRAEDLTTWNSTAWVPGNLIYYVSPADAADTAMKSLYEERELTPNSITVKRGESISQIALKRLGHVNSWKELAVVNNLDRPDSLTRGQKLNYYPELGEAPALAAPPPTPAPVAAPVTPPPPAPVTPPPPPPAPVAQAPIEKPRVPERKEKPEVNISKLLKQNLFFITMGLGVGLLLLALIAINRKKRDTASGAGEEFNEDAFAPPRKKRR